MENPHGFEANVPLKAPTLFNEEANILNLKVAFLASLGSLLSHNKGLAQTGKKNLWQQEKMKGSFFINIYMYTYIYI